MPFKPRMLWSRNIQAQQDLRTECCPIWLKDSLPWLCDSAAWWYAHLTWFISHFESVWVPECSLSYAMLRDENCLGNLVRIQKIHSTLLSGAIGLRRFDGTLTGTSTWGKTWIPWVVNWIQDSQKDCTLKSWFQMGITHCKHGMVFRIQSLDNVQW